MTIIASEVGGIPEILPPECLVKPGDSEQLAQAVLRQLSQPLQPSLSAEVMGHLDCRRMIREIVEFYLNLS
jgi:glycosyltransferase involved in cell wall biosynthesis